MQHKKLKLTERSKNLLIIVLGVLVVASIVINLISSRSGTLVEAQYVGPGKISQTLRGSGAAVSNASVEVMSEKSCVLYSLPVAVGDEVNAGDVLALCAKVSAEEAEKLREEIDGLVLKYQQDLIDKSAGRYDSELRDIERAQKKLDDAKAKCAELLVTDAEISAAEAYVTECENAVIMQEDEVSRLEALGGAGTADALKAAEDELEAVMMNYGSDYEVLVAKANELMEKAGYTTEAQKEEKLAQYLVLAISEQKARIEKLNEEYPEEIIPFVIRDELKLLQASIDSYDKVKPAQDKVKAAQKQLGLSDARKELVTLNRKKSDAEAALKKLQDRRKEWETLNDGLEALRAAVDTATQALATAQKAGQKEDIQLAADEEKIESKRAELNDLTNDGQPKEILSTVHGIVTAISANPGNSIAADTSIMTIEASDMGYTVSIPVTPQQSKLVNPGELGTVSVGFDPVDIGAVLEEIKNDPDHPGEKKLLVFRLSGDVQSDMQLNLTIAKPDEEYDLVVPLDALREDSEGCYVLKVDAKRGLFGTGYKAQRVAVSVSSRDDALAAVSGELSGGDMVITTHPLEISTGAKVRLPD